MIDGVFGVMKGEFFVDLQKEQEVQEKQKTEVSEAICVSHRDLIALLPYLGYGVENQSYPPLVTYLNPYIERKESISDKFNVLFKSYIDYLNYCYTGYIRCAEPTKEVYALRPEQIVFYYNPLYMKKQPNISEWDYLCDVFKYKELGPKECREVLRLKHDANHKKSILGTYFFGYNFEKDPRYNHNGELLKKLSDLQESEYGNVDPKDILFIKQQLISCYATDHPRLSEFYKEQMGYKVRKTSRKAIFSLID